MWLLYHTLIKTNPAPEPGHLGLCDRINKPIPEGT